MKTINEIRLDNLEALITEFGKAELVAEKGETSSVYLSQIRNRAPDKKTGKLRQMGDDIARKLERGCNKEIGWMDNTHQTSAALLYSKAADTPFEAHAVHEQGATPIPLPVKRGEYDVWTLAAIDMLQRMDIGQRQAMVARMREYTQFLEPPRIGQAL